MRQEKWLDKPYYSLDAYMKYTYGQKVYKIAVDAGLTCPNRDGTLGERGCIFCSAGGSGDFAVPIAGGGRQDGQSVVGASANGRVYEHRSKRDSRGASTEVYHKEYERRGSCVDVERKTLDIKRQMERGMAKFHKKVGEKFVIYFQAYTNTYGDPAYLERIWREALEEESVVGISIATRPDCLGIPGVSVAVKKAEMAAVENQSGNAETVISILGRLQKEYAESGKFIWIELGLQTMHEKTAQYIRRGYPLSCFEQAVNELQRRGIPVIVHTILGLPGEGQEEVFATMDYLNGLSISGIKLQLLHVLKHTDLADYYVQTGFHIFSEDEYVSLVIRCLEALSPDITIHRLTGDGPSDLLIAPLWSLKKRSVLNHIHHELKVQGTWQGRLFSEP